MTIEQAFWQTVRKRAVEIGGELFQRIGREVERLATDAGAEVDARLANLRREINGDVLRLPPADGDPRVRRHEGIGRALTDDGQAVVAPRPGFHLVGHEKSTQTCAENHDMRHGIPSVRGLSPVCRRRWRLASPNRDPMTVGTACRGPFEPAQGSEVVRNIQIL